VSPYEIGTGNPPPTHAFVDHGPSGLSDVNTDTPPPVRQKQHACVTIANQYPPHDRRAGASAEFGAPDVLFVENGADEATPLRR
jgi:hypothetical protein